MGDIGGFTLNESTIVRPKEHCKKKWLTDWEIKITINWYLYTHGLVTEADILTCSWKVTGVLIIATFHLEAILCVDSL